MSCKQIRKSPLPGHREQGKVVLAGAPDYTPERGPTALIRNHRLTLLGAPSVDRVCYQCGAIFVRNRDATWVRLCQSCWLRGGAL